MATIATPRRRTPRKSRLVQVVLNNTAGSKPLSTQNMMLHAGYSLSTARARSAEIMESIFREPEVILHFDRLKRIRSKMLDRLEATIDTAPFNSVVVGFAVIERSIRLLEGKEPPATSYVLSDEEKEELDAIIKANG